MQISVVDLEIVTKYQIDIEIRNPFVYGIETAGPIFTKEIGKANVEKVAVLCLDHTNKIINFAIVSIGNEEEVNMSMSQLLRIALLSNASKIIVTTQDDAIEVTPLCCLTTCCRRHKTNIFNV